MEDAQQEERVLHWLKKRGYTEVAKHYEEDQAHAAVGSAEEGNESEDSSVPSGAFTDERLLCKRIGEANQSALLFRSLRMSDPMLYHRNYNELQTWTCNALEAYKPELLTVAFPVFVHSYLKLVERGMIEAARAFLQTWGPDHAETYQLELRSLTAVQRPDHLTAGNGFVKRALTDKFVLRLCSISYRLLQSFLSDHNLLLIMEILNEQVHVVVEERPPMPRFQVVTFRNDGIAGGGGVPGGRGGGRRDSGSPVRGGRGQISHAFTVRWRATGLGGSDVKDDSSRPPYNAPLFQKLEALAAKTRQEIAMGVADPGNPTVLMASLTNTYDGCTVARMTTDATQLAAGFHDRAVRVFRLAGEGPVGMENGNGSKLHSDGGEQAPEGPLIMRGHSQPVHGVSWAPEQQHLLSASSDGTVRLWDVAASRNVCVYRSPTDVPVWDVSFAPVGHYFASGSYDRVGRVWCTNRTQPVRLLVGHYSDVSCVAWHPNCSYLVTGSWDKTVRLWDLGSGRCFRLYSGHFGPVTALTVSPDGQFLAGAGLGGGQGNEDGVIRIWQVASGREVAVLRGHEGPVHRLNYSADGTVLASGGADMTVRTWDMNGDFASLMSSVSLAPHSTFHTKATPVLDVTFTKRNLLLASGPIMS